MTSNTTGFQWVPKPPNHSTAHVFKRPTLPGTDPHPSTSDAEPALKKQKLDPLLAALDFANNQDKAIPTPRNTALHPSDLQTCNSSSHTANQSTIVHLDGLAAPSPLFPARLPLDQLPTRRKPQDAVSQRATRNVGAVQTKPFVLETPSAAPRYPSTASSGSIGELIEIESTHLSSAEEAAADFSPWRAIHPEDVLSEFTTKHGFYDKIQVSQNESGTGRPTAWRNYKQQSGLEVLSSLFVSVLNQRQAHGSITAACTFKPPPRVTLTDSKREVWLRDLAKPAVPLRRLSRTIPHGIRGRVLLDHSLAKKIPTSRSLWLAKCVGANEIRAFKRKGASGAFAFGGELKWIKEWTANVEQFLDALINTCGSDGWRDDMTYGLRLATHLFAENLLDRDHYFDWLLTTVSQGNLETLPLYLHIITSHLKELGQYRRYGRRLADSLLEQLHTIENKVSPDLYATVKTKILSLIDLFIVASPASFLMPRRWPRYQSMLESVIKAPLATLFRHIDERNIRLQFMAGFDTESEANASQTLIKILDSIASGSNISSTARTLWEVAPDPELLIRTCLCWSTSIFSASCARVYIAAQLIQSWSGMELDVQTHVLHFLAVDTKAADLENANLYRIIAELIRSGHFSVGRYLNWVIANGLVRRVSETDKVSPAIELLTEIPSHGLSAHISNLRRNLLRSVGLKLDDEEHSIPQWRALFDREPMDQHEESAKFLVADRMPNNPREHTLAVKLNVGHLIRQKLSGQSASGQAPFERPHGNTIPDSILDESELGSVLAVLESLEDFRAMGDFLSFHSKSPQPQTLTSIAVTVSHYLDIFQACCTADTIFMQLMQQHTKLNNTPGYLGLIEALIDLAECLPNRSRDTRSLRKHREKHASKSSVAACSPISEHMAEAIQTEHSGLSLPCTDDIEQLLASGTSMDKQLLRHVFGLIWKRFENGIAESIPSGFAEAVLLTRLRPFDPTAFTEMTIWRVDEVLASGSRVAHQAMCIAMVCAKVMTFEKVLNRMLQALQQALSPSVQSELLAGILDCLTLGRRRASSSTSHLYYRFYAQQQRALRDLSPATVSLLQHILAFAYKSPEDSPLNICKLLQKPAFMALLRRLPESNQEGKDIFREIFGPGLMEEGAVQTFCRLASPSAIGDDQGSKDDRLRVLFDNVTQSNLSFCELSLEAILVSRRTMDENAAPMLVLVTLEMLPFSSTRKITQWVSIINGLPPQQKQAIGDQAETEIFVLLSNTPQPSTTDFSKKVDCLLSLVGVADYSVHTTVSATRIITQVHNAIVRLSASPLLSESGPDSKAGIKNSEPSTEPLEYVKLYAVLRLLHIHHTAFCTPNVSEDALTKLLVQLGLLLGLPWLDTDTYLSIDICDFLTVISDLVSATIQARCIRVFQRQHRWKDSRLLYIFASSDNEENTWLQLSAGTPGSTRPPALHPFPIRKWETLQDATPLMTQNDTSISMSLFGAKKSVL
ncbi:MAG: hypothetical protein Q9168_000376 [Polycauliona sp. 1 TL-2023]